MAEYDNTYIIESSIGNAPILAMITLRNLRLVLSEYMHNHVEHELFYVLSGTATLVHHYGEQPLKTHSFCLIPSGLYHHITNRSADVKMASLRFKFKRKGPDISYSPEINQIIHYLSIPKPYVLELEQFPFYQALMATFFSDTLQPPLLFQDRFKAEISLILCHMFEQIILASNVNPTIFTEAKAQLSSSQNTVELIEHMLSERYMEKLTLDDVAKTINMSKSYTLRLIKSLYGISFSKKLTETRLIMSQYLMRDSSLPLYTIAEQCGYISYDHFSKSFKAFYGLTPEKFRKNYENSTPILSKDRLLGE